MKPGLSPSLVKKSLAGHSWIGILIGFPMYLICLSGTIVVFFPEYERWEQPTIAEMATYDPAVVDRAYGQALSRLTEETHHMFVTLPRDDMPRVMVASDHQGWHVNADGSLGERVQHDWTHFLIHLHLYLNLPENFGMILVSAMGALLCGLIISGFLAHPGIFRDAFNLRLRGNRQLEQTDIHNRLSVWGAPFHLMIGVTGAYFGLAGLMSLIIAYADFGGDRDAVIETVFGAEPELSQPLEPAAVGTALGKMEAIAPEQVPFYVTVEDVGTPQQYIIVGAAVPERLVYAEQYRFDTAGNYLDKAGFTDGDTGRQTIFSVYRLHFGHFGGFPVKVLFGILGLALTVVSVTGINIWLAKRKKRDGLNNIWTGLVWGAPALLAIAGILQVHFGIDAAPVFWIGLVVAIVLAEILSDERWIRVVFQLLAGAGALGIALGHALQHGGAAFGSAALGVNVALVIIAAVMIWLGFRQLHGKSQTRENPSQDKPVPDPV